VDIQPEPQDEGRDEEQSASDPDQRPEEPGGEADGDKGAQEKDRGGDATESQIARLLAAGARAYVTKPFDVRRLLAVIMELLESVDA
jgi:hypothetical protein